MKPCYYYGEELLVLAQIRKEEGNWWHSCKARIRQGTPSSTTTISKKVAERAGWWTLPDGEASHQGAPVILHCKLRVGRCELSADVYITDEEASSEQGIPFDWHIHLGESVVETLICDSWDADVCYLDGLCKKGSASALGHSPNCCNCFAAALDSGHADCLRYWHADQAAMARNFPDGQAKVQLETSAELPSAEAMMHLHDVLGVPWDKDAIITAAWAGSINCLSFAHCSGCPWDAYVCNAAAIAGSLGCLMYAHEHGCVWDERTCMAAAKRGRFDCLVYAHEHGCQWDEGTCWGAAASGSLKCLAYAYEQGCPWDASACEGAAVAGSMECLMYAHNRGCPWDEKACKAAARGGSLQCLRYAHEHGCSWTESTLLAAAQEGNLECLMYAHKHGCPYDPGAARDSSRCYMDGLAFATVLGETSLPCLKYVHESMGCVWDPDGREWRVAFQWGQCHVLRYIHQHGGAHWGYKDLGYVAKTLNIGDSDEFLDGKARCVLYMHRSSGCKLLPMRGTKVGKRVAIMRERTAAVLLCFRAAGRAIVGNRSDDAAHAAMARVPADIIKDIMCAANLNPD